MALPSLVLVPGAWHRPEHFGPLSDELSDIDTHVVRLTSTGDDPSALGDMYDDAGVIAATIEAIDGPVVVVAHSYGGIPATQALANASGVQRLVHLSAFHLDAGESLVSSLGGSLAPWCRVHEQDGVPHHVDVVNPIEVFYQDMDTASAERAAAQLGWHSYLSFAQRLHQADRTAIPSTYVICETDNALAPVLQEQFARQANDVVRIDSSHSPFLSRPAELARLLRNELLRD